jgi:hypothetical protein
MRIGPAAGLLTVFFALGRPPCCSDALLSASCLLDRRQRHDRIRSASSCRQSLQSLQRRISSASRTASCVDRSDSCYLATGGAVN